MTVAELIAHLQTLPQGLTVQCVEEQQKGYNTWTIWKDLTLDDLNQIGSYLEIGAK